MSAEFISLDIPEEIAGRWSISTASLIADTESSIVHRATLADGSSAILKRLKPRGLGELPGMTFLKWRNGQGAVRLLQRSGTACLLEDAGDLTLRAHRLHMAKKPRTSSSLAFCKRSTGQGGQKLWV